MPSKRCVVLQKRSTAFVQSLPFAPLALPLPPRAALCRGNSQTPVPRREHRHLSQRQSSVSLVQVSAPVAAIIYSAEPLWGAGLAYWLLGERWGPLGWAGAGFCERPWHISACTMAQSSIPRAAQATVEHDYTTLQETGLSNTVYSFLNISGNLDRRCGHHRVQPGGAAGRQQRRARRPQEGDLTGASSGYCHCRGRNDDRARWRASSGIDGGNGCSGSRM